MSQCSPKRNPIITLDRSGFISNSILEKEVFSASSSLYYNVFLVGVGLVTCCYCPSGCILLFKFKKQAKKFKRYKKLM